MRLGRLAICATLAAVALASAVATATAATGTSVTNGVTLAAANGSTTFDFAGIVDICTVTLGIGLNRSFTKRLLTQIGTVLPSPSGTNITGCDLLSFGAVLPSITIGYVSYTRTLPTITRYDMRSNNFSMLFEFPIIGSCLYIGPLNMSFNRNTLTGRIETIATSGTLTPDIADCPTPLTITSTLFVLPTQPTLVLI